MKDFKKSSDIEQLSPDDPVRPLIQELINYLMLAYTDPGEEYNAEDYGWIRYIENDDLDKDVWQGWTLSEIPWEGIMLKDGYYQMIFLANNEFGMIFVLEPSDRIQGDLRQVIDENLDPPI